MLSHIEGYDDTKTGLLVYHGMADDNVFFAHSTRLYNALQNANKLYQSLDYPGKHSMDGEKVKLHLYRSIFTFFESALKTPH